MNLFNVTPPTHPPSLTLKFPGLRFLPYLGFGVLIFWLTSQSDLNYFLRGYLLVLEIQGGLLLLFLLISKLKK